MGLWTKSKAVAYHFRVLKRLEDMNNEIRELLRRQQDLQCNIAEQMHRLRGDLLAQRYLTRPATPENTSRPKQLTDCFDLETSKRALSGEVPNAFREWNRLLEINASSYDGLPSHSCSIDGNSMANEFAAFLQPYLRGQVLDIGCGPQPVPSYLANYPTNKIAGIDPISRREDHPFEFVSGVCEYLPWANEQFDVAVAATSLDHVLLLERSFSEIKRVLRPSGHFVTWVTFVEGAKPYDPRARNIKPIDQFHLFHFSKNFFLRSVEPYFNVAEAFHFDWPYESAFYALTPI